MGWERHIHLVHNNMYGLVLKNQGRAVSVIDKYKGPEKGKTWVHQRYRKEAGMDGTE